MNKEFKTEDLKEIMWGGDTENLELVEEGDWISEGKYECADFTFKDKRDGKFYQFYCSRSGSHFSDWYYDHEDWGDTHEATEVEKVEVVTTTWQAVK